MEQRRGTFVGRDDELGEATRGLASALDGRGCLFVLTGEGGIGKTRLAAEIATLARSRGFVVGWGRCAEVGGAPAFGPWVELVRSLRRALTRAGAPATDALGDVLPRLAGEKASPMLDARQARVALFEDVVRALCALADEGPPLALVFDDIHASDPSSVALVRFLAREVVDTRIFLLLTYREHELREHVDGGDSVQRLAREATFLPLRRMDSSEVRALLTQYDGTVSSEVVAHVLRATDGNAFFVEEIARALARGHVGDRPPTGVRGAIGQRLAGLAPETRRIVLLASVIGRYVDSALLARVAGLSPGHLRTALEPAEATGMLVRNGDDYAFSHLLTRDVVYRELGSAERNELHAEIAAALSEARGIECARASIAEHLLAAIDRVGAASVLAASIEAASAAVASFAFEDAARLLERAATVIGPRPVDPRQRAEALVRLGEAKVRSGDTEAGSRACAEAAAIARSIGDPELLARAALACGTEIAVAFVDRTLLDLLRDALAALPDSELTLRARVLARLAGAEQPAGDPRGPMERARHAIALARASADRLTLRMALEYGGSALVDYADPTERVVLAAEMRDLAVEAGDSPSVFRAHLRLYFDHLELGDSAAADVDAAALARVADTLGWPRMRRTATMTRACSAAFRGRFEEALELADLARIPGSSQRETDLLFRIGVALLEDRAERVEPLLIELRRLWRDRAPLFLDWTTQIHAVARARLGDVQGARDVVRTIARDAPSFVFEPPSTQLAAELIGLLGDREWAAELLPHVRNLQSRFAAWGQIGMLAFHPFSLWIAVLEATLGHYDDAFAAFDDAERRATEAGARAALAWTLHHHAVARARAGDVARAADLALRGAALAGELGLSRLASRITDASPGAPPSSRQPGRVLSAFSLRLDGEVWCVAVGTQSVRLKDSRGMRMLARLVSEPGREIHALLLAAENGGSPDLGTAGFVIDRTAIDAYRQRVESLRDAIEQADAFGDHSRADKAREELDFVVRELAAGVGLGGRKRIAGSVAERARVNVQRRVKDAVKRIAEQDAELGEYLGWTIRTGTFCSYRPPKPTPSR